MGFSSVFLVVLLLVGPCAFATQYNVNWGLGQDYSSWATKPLNAGDTLVFSYDSSHSVDVVSQSDFKSCISSNALQSDNSGTTTITLKGGPMYFICGTAGHCTSGMALQVNAQTSGSTPSTPSSTPATPSGSGSTPTTPSSGSGSGSTPSSTTPTTPSSTKGTTGAAVISSANLMLGVSVVFGTLVALIMA